MAASFEKINYHATWRQVDSKYWYIPHTRARGYLIAINRDHLESKGVIKYPGTARTVARSSGISSWAEAKDADFSAASATVEEFVLR